MWTRQTTEEYDRRVKRYRKDHPRELDAVLANLETYIDSLNAGVKPLQVKHGFMHHEPLGVVAIDQKGGKGKLAQTRLYVYADLTTEVLHLLTLGDKTTQKPDIQSCREYVRDLQQQAEERRDDDADATEAQEEVEDTEDNEPG